jgi:chromosome segregation ATPase
MTNKKRMNCYLGIAFFITYIFFFSSDLCAQMTPIDSLRSAIITKESSLQQLDNIHQRVMQSFKVLNKEIFRQKKALETSSNPIVRLKLDTNLKESSSLALKIKKLKEDKQHLSQNLQNVYKQLIAVIDGLIKSKMQAVHVRQTKQAQIEEALNIVGLLEGEKKVLQNKLLQSSPITSKKPLLKIEPDDSIERIKLKIQVLQDRILKIDGDLIQLNKRRLELQADLQIYEEMLSFMENLQQNIDPEQEYFDEEQNEQIKDDVRNTKLKISGIEGRFHELSNQKKELQNKLHRFEEYYENMLTR